MPRPVFAGHLPPNHFTHMTTKNLHLILAVGCLSLAATSRSATTFVGFDTATQGNWIGVYGSTGYILQDYYRLPTDGSGGGGGVYDAVPNLAFDAVSLPSYISGYSYAGGAQAYLWETNQAGPRPLQDPAAPGGPRNAATVFDGDTYNVTLTLSAPQQFQMAIYAIDWDGPLDDRGLSLSLDGVLTQVDDYTAGKWMVYDVNAPAGNYVISITNTGPVNAVISGIAFSVPEPSSLALLGFGVLGLLRRRRASFPG